MSTKLGYRAGVYMGTTRIGNVTASNFGIGMSTEDQRAYGDAYGKPVVTGRQLTGSFSGHLNPANSQQAELLDAVLDSTSTDPQDVCVLTNEIRIYEDATNYWTADTSADADAHFVITNFSKTDDPSGLVAFSCDFMSYGPVKRTS